VNETTENSQTALVLAAQRGHTNVVEQLLDLKADFTISDDSDRTVLHYAIEYPEMLKLLLKVSHIIALFVLDYDADRGLLNRTLSQFIK
jgi:ankyrin repeat protein